MSVCAIEPEYFRLIQLFWVVPSAVELFGKKEARLGADECEAPQAQQPAF